MLQEISNERPLSGIRVLELSHLIAGPYCAQTLADEGASVVKVEPPGGELTRKREPMRHVGDEKVAAYYASLNRGKQSVVLDLKNPAGLDVMERLLAASDVFVTNMRVAALERLGLHPQALHQRFPRLIVACISGFGMENADAHTGRAGLAMVAEALSGATGLTRDQSGNPVWCGFALGDITASLSAHAAILLALRQQERHGMGRVIDIGLVECMLPMVSVAMGRVQVEDQACSGFSGSNGFHGVPYGAFPAADGFVNIGVNSDEFWRRLCSAMGRPELGTDARYATYVQRAQRQQEVHAITEQYTRAHTRAELTAQLSAADVPVAGILSMNEVITDDYLRERGAVMDVDDGYGGRFVLPADPAWPAQDGVVPRIPRLGEHRDAVLGQGLGLSIEEIERLERSGAFGGAAPQRPARPVTAASTAAVE